MQYLEREVKSHSAELKNYLSVTERLLTGMSINKPDAPLMNRRAYRGMRKESKNKLGLFGSNTRFFGR
jgi:hypothetical protein